MVSAAEWYRGRQMYTTSSLDTCPVMSYAEAAAKHLTWDTIAGLGRPKGRNKEAGPFHIHPQYIYTYTSNYFKSW